MVRMRRDVVEEMIVISTEDGVLLTDGIYM